MILICLAHEIISTKSFFSLRVLNILQLVWNVSFKCAPMTQITSHQKVKILLFVSYTTSTGSWRTWLHPPITSMLYGGRSYCPSGNPSSTCLPKVYSDTRMPRVHLMRWWREPSSRGRKDNFELYTRRKYIFFKFKIIIEMLCSPVNNFSNVKFLSVLIVIYFSELSQKRDPHQNKLIMWRSIFSVQEKYTTIWKPKERNVSWTRLLPLPVSNR